MLASGRFVGFVGRTLTTPLHLNRKLIIRFMLNLKYTVYNFFISRQSIEFICRLCLYRLLKEKGTIGSMNILLVIKET